MSNTTINISLPKFMLQDAKKYADQRGYVSISELVRDILRHEIYSEDVIPPKKQN